MTFQDIIKKNVLEGFSLSGLSTTKIVLTLGIAVAFGIFIYIIYRVTTTSGFYNRGFNKSLAILPAITASIILAMQSSLVISLGMVGALSIVRFRNAVKDPMDLTYLFWSISIGIVVGAGLFELALIASLVMTVLIFALDAAPVLKAPCLLIVSAELELDDDAFWSSVRKYAPKAKVRSRNVTKSGKEIIVEMQIKNEVAMLNEIMTIQGIRTANVLTHDGEVRL
ncbi:MAG: DUF4956 domain-containing protein [Clostridiaceae bacterium]|jgi:uncharacterized membrane protein YhiD involved in acid resistance|nr:DUF4956 domain-containing protein [Clostridiaceae bacterium]